MFACVFACLFACTEDPELGPPPSNMTTPVTGIVGEDEADETATDTNAETSSPDDLPACDPFEDPVISCGPGLECSFATFECEAAPGQGGEGEICEDELDCLAGLVCEWGRCREPCDPELVDAAPDDPGTCPADQLCTVAEQSAAPGTCAPPCSLVDQDCLEDGTACNRGLGAGGQLLAVCTQNPGAAFVGDACESDGDCNVGLLCTPASDHTLPCAGEAPSCCAAICDPLLLPCSGLEPVCYVLGIADQDQAGYCGAA